MKPANKLWLLGLITLIAIIIVCMLRPMAQPVSYHDFADKRVLFGIPHFSDVISNLPFLIVGIAGLLSLKKSTASGAVSGIYAVMFIGILLTGLGSAYYHYAPNNNSLVYDRLPMTLVFMALLSATIAEFINVKAGTRSLLPFLLLGIASVLWWHYTEVKGRGDMRLYGLVQYYPVVFIPLIMLLFRSKAYDNASRQLIWAVLWYVVAKIGEHFDKQIYSFAGISGHTLKHLAAAAATWYLVKMFRQKYMVSALPGSV